MEYQDFLNFPFVFLSLKTPWDRIQMLYTIDNHKSEHTPKIYEDEFNRIFKSIKERSPEANAELLIKVVLIPVIPVDNIVSKLENLTSQKLKSTIASTHLSEMYECYTEIQDYEGAKYHAEIALRFQPEPENLSSANNLGYLLMSIGSLEKAKSLFEIANKYLINLPKGNSLVSPSRIIDHWGSMDALIHYNLGIVAAMQSDFQQAVDFIQLSIGESQEKEDNKCACVFVPEIIDGRLAFREVLEPDLLDVAKSSLETINTYRINIRPQT